MVTACNTYTWNRTGLTYTTSGNRDYTFVNGTCTDTVRLHLTISSTPALFITDPSGVCSPATVDITSSSLTTGSDQNLTYTYWTNANATTVLSNPKAIAVSGNYYIKATNRGGCSIIKPVKVTINNPPAVNLAAPAAICYGSTASLTVTLTGTAPFRFTYTDGTNTNTVGPISSNTYQFTVDPTANTTYTINSVIDAYCSSTGNLTSATITVTPAPFGHSCNSPY